MTRALVIVVLASISRLAFAQPDPNGETVLRPVVLDVGRCDPPEAATPDTGIPTTWGEYDIAGDLVDPEATVRALLDPTLQQSHALTSSARADIKRALRSFGYHIVGMTTREVSAGVRLNLHLAPLPLVRRVAVDVNQDIFDVLFEDEIRRRMRLRVGTYMPWAPDVRACEVKTEEKRLENYLFEEGYFDAKVRIEEDHDGQAVKLRVRVDLGDPYEVATSKIKFVRAPGAPELMISDADMRGIFVHKGRCAIAGFLCYGTPRFTIVQHNEDIKALVATFQARGYPAVRITDDFDPNTKTSFDRRSKTVTFTLTIDPRRKLDVFFEGHDPNQIPDDQLDDQLTFNAAGSSDDVEAQESAKALVNFLQTRGFFDARVTWNRERFPSFDRVGYRIDQGGQRKVRDVQFVGNHAVSTDTLEDAVATKELKLSNQLLGTTIRATSSQMIADVDRITALYARIGYRDAHVRVVAGTDPAALDSIALSAALLASNRGAGQLYVRFTIVEGEPTLLTQIRVELGTGGDEVKTPEDRKLCDLALAKLAVLLGDNHFASPVTQGRCIGIAPNVKYRAGDVEGVKDLLRERLWNIGRPRTVAELTAHELGPHRFEAVYKLRNTEELKMGKVVVRGNFKTRESVIIDELGFREGAPLTADALADAARRLRTTGLFDAVNIDMPDLERTNAGEVHAVVHVEERYDNHGIIDLETGGSSYSGVFVKVSPQFKNLFGLGLSLDTSFTYGVDFYELYNNSTFKQKQLNAEASFKIPGFLGRQILDNIGLGIDIATEISAFLREQDTPRFGPISTKGASLLFSKTIQRPRTESSAQHAITVGAHYDFRLRERQVDVLRPIGADDDQTQVPIATRTGSVGLSFEWEQRTDRNGYLSPLAPEGGFRLDAQVSVASPRLLGQDTFIKASVAASKFTALSNSLVLRSDLRYDQGFPLGGAVLLPEVERFFAGGDATVRGYADERMATEIIQVGVPPLANIEQIRILSAGGNIRVMGSLDAQLRIYKVLASALFVDAGLIANKWETVELDDIRPSVGMALVRIITPFGSFAFERAIPLRPHLGDDPRGRWHISFAARAQF